jgi:four helix bundle protein
MTTQAGLGDGHSHGDGHGPGSLNTGAEQAQPQHRRRNDLHRLDVYRCSLKLYREVRRIVDQFPRGEADLRSQMRRASRSVPFNIGEGVGKRGRARIAAYEIALGETKELIVALDCVEIDDLAPLAEIVSAQERTDRIPAMLTRLMESVERGPSP